MATSLRKDCSAPIILMPAWCLKFLRAKKGSLLLVIKRQPKKGARKK